MIFSLTPFLGLPLNPHTDRSKQFCPEGIKFPQRVQEELEGACIPILVLPKTSLYLLHLVKTVFSLLVTIALSS